MSKIDHPSHYNQGPLDADGTAKYEAIKVIEDWSLGFKMGNALKYILRAPHKGSEEDDLNKAIWYLLRQLTRDDHPDRDGPEFTMDAMEVAEAWGLSDHLAAAVRFLQLGTAAPAIQLIRSHLREKGLLP